MSLTCTFHRGGQRCAARATHVALSMGQRGDWEPWDTLVPLRSPPRTPGVTIARVLQPEFCATHAQAVADARNAVCPPQARALRGLEDTP